MANVVGQEFTYSAKCTFPRPATTHTSTYVYLWAAVVVAQRRSTSCTASLRRSRRKKRRMGRAAFALSCISRILLNGSMSSARERRKKVKGVLDVDVR